MCREARPRLDAKLPSEIRPLQILGAIQHGAPHREGGDSRLVESRDNAGRVEGAVYRIAGAGMRKLEVKMCRGRQAATRMPETDPRRSEAPERCPGIARAQESPSNCFLKPSPGPGFGPIHALNSASANGFPSMMPFCAPRTSTTVPFPGRYVNTNPSPFFPSSM